MSAPTVTREDREAAAGWVPPALQDALTQAFAAHRANATADLLALLRGIVKADNAVNAIAPEAFGFEPHTEAIAKREAAIDAARRRLTDGK